MDVSASPSTVKGSQYQFTADGVTYTLPCGPTIPPGAACTCNCVPGTGCACVTDPGCNCACIPVWR